jgi:hypothetical protein
LISPEEGKSRRIAPTISVRLCRDWLTSRATISQGIMPESQAMKPRK